MNKYSVLILMLCFVSCSKPSLQNHHWSDWEPYVISVSPQMGDTVSLQSQFEIEFSQPLLETTVTAENIFFIAEADLAIYADDWMDLADAVRDNDIVSLPISLNLDQNKTRLQVSVDWSGATFVDGVLFLTPQILSTQYVPINQSAVSGHQKYFMADYHLSVVASSQTEEEVPLQDVSTLPDQTSVDLTQDNSTTEVYEQHNEVFSYVIDSVIFSEIVTDPQQDFNDSSGGNGILFDAVVGAGTVGSTDEYIELYNGSGEVVNLTGFHIQMIDGTDEEQILSAESWVGAYFSGESNFEAFLPNEFVVLGNPEGSINNTITINLLDSDGGLMESILIDDANSDSLINESYSLDFETGFWEMTEATPGF